MDDSKRNELTQILASLAELTHWQVSLLEKARKLASQGMDRPAEPTSRQ